MFFKSITPNYLYYINIHGKQIPAQTKKASLKILWILPQQLQMGTSAFHLPALTNKEGSQE